MDAWNLRVEGNFATRALVKDLRAINIGKHSCLGIVNQCITWLYSIESTHRLYLKTNTVLHVFFCFVPHIEPVFTLMPID